jgi:hypothetical protein
MVISFTNSHGFIGMHILIVVAESRVEVYKRSSLLSADYPRIDDEATCDIAHALVISIGNEVHIPVKV